MLDPLREAVRHLAESVLAGDHDAASADDLLVTSRQLADFLLREYDASDYPGSGEPE